MIWLLIGMAVDGLITLMIGVVLSLTLANPLMPHLPAHSLQHSMANLRVAVSHWDHRA